MPDKYGHVPIDACDSYYNFYPSFEGNLAFAVLFGVCTLVHLAQAVAYKKVRSLGRCSGRKGERR